MGVTERRRWAELKIHPVERTVQKSNTKTIWGRIESIGKSAARTLVERKGKR